MKQFMTHVNILRSCNKVFVPLRPLEYDAGASIALRTNHLEIFLKTVRLDKPCHLVTGFTDYPPELFLSRTEFEKLIEKPEVLSWSAMNTIWNHPKLVHLESGLYDHVIDYYVENAERLQKIPKKNDVFYSFSVECNRYERGNLPNSGRVPLADYADTMASYKYVYCPLGLGMDCSKVYEAIACGCIPIVKVPEGFVDTYRKFNFVCIPGTCHVLVGILDSPNFVYTLKSPYVSEKPDVINSLDVCTFEGTLYHTREYIVNEVLPGWKYYNDNVLRHGFIGLKLVDIHGHYGANRITYGH